MPTARKGATRREILKRLARVGREHSDATLIFHATLAGRLGLHPTDYKAMSILERLGPLSAGALAGHTGLATASVTNLLDRLERKGFIRRSHDAEDRRRVVIEPVAARIAPARPLFAPTRESLARLLASYSDRELGVIADFLSRNGVRLRAETRRLEGQSTPHAGRTKGDDDE